jgi:glutathione S-transferase
LTLLTEGELTMSVFTVHTIPGSPFARAVLATLEEKKAPYKVVPVAPGTLKSEAHLAWHPFGRIPVLVHEGFRLYETQAILRYLDRALPAPSLTPADAQAAARMDQIMNINDWYLFQGVASVIVFQRIVGPKVMGLTSDETAIAAAMPKARVVIGELSRLLGHQVYLAGDSVSLADFHLAPQLDLLAMTPEWSQLSTNAGNLNGWLGRMGTRASMTATTWERVAEMARAA